MKLEFYSDHGYPGQGISRELARGLLVRHGGVNITQEGMGLGAPALVRRGITCFSRSVSTDIKEDVILKSYTIDTCMIWGIWGMESRTLTSLLTELNTRCVSFQNIRLQKAFFYAGYRLKTFFGLKHRFVPGTPMAIYEFRYFTGRDSVRVECTIHSLEGPLTKLYIMNELGADFFNCAMIKGKLTGPPSGWLQIKNDYASHILCSRFYHVGFSLLCVTTPDDVLLRVFWGREKNIERCWAGFDLEIDCKGTDKRMIQVHYTLSFQTNGMP